ncbi:hypothetical protein UlMin_005633 [Ulmus minor]
MNEKEKVTIRAVSHDKECRKRVEKKELDAHNIDKIKYVEKKMNDKGLMRLDRHPANGIGIGKPPPKSGHGGKYTWEGPDEIAELSPPPPAIDENDPNYVEEEEVMVDDGVVVGVVEAAKVAEEREGVARIEIDPHLKLN